MHGGQALAGAAEYWHISGCSGKLTVSNEWKKIL